MPTLESTEARLNALLASKTTVTGPSCGITPALEKVEPDERAVIEKWLAMTKKEIQHVGIARVLTEMSGVKVSGDTVARHRRGDCHCRG